MSLDQLETFLLWSTLINFGLLIVSFASIRLMGQGLKTQYLKFIQTSEVEFQGQFVLLLGLYKILIIVFNLVPYLVIAWVLNP